MDDKDLSVLAAVSRLKTGSPEKISQEISIPKSTVHYRLEKLREDGVIKNDLFDMDLAKIGLDITVISEVWAEYKEEYHNQVGEKLSDVEGVNQVYFTMGGSDFIVIANLPNRAMVEELVEEYEKIEEIERTNSQFVIKTIKNEPRPLNDVNLETLTETLSGDSD